MNPASDTVSALPTVSRDESWPTFVVSLGERGRTERRTIRLSPPDPATIIGERIGFGQPAPPSVPARREWKSNTPPITAPPPPVNAPQTPGRNRRTWAPAGPGAGTPPAPAQVGAPTPAVPAVRPRPAAQPAALGAVPAVRVLGAASPRREQLATRALIVAITGIFLPVIVALFLTYVSNVVALTLATVAFFMARSAVGIPPLSNAGKQRAIWAQALSIVIAILWIALFFAGI